MVRAPHRHARPRRCRCTATPTRSTRSLVGRKVELVFYPFDLATHRGALRRAAPPGRPSRTSSAATPTPKPDPSSPNRPPPRPASTTSGCSTPPTTASLAGDDIGFDALSDPPPAQPVRSAAGAADHRRGALPERTGGTVSIEKLAGPLGFTRMPFGRDLAPSMLHRHAAHAEAAARIGWCIERARPRRDHRRSRRRQDRRRPRRHRQPRRIPARRHLPANPSVGVRGMLTTSSPRSATSRASTTPRSPPRPRTLLGRRARRTGPHPGRGRRRGAPARHAQLEAVRMLTNHDMDSGCPLACVLIGQPTLRRRIQLGVLAALVISSLS